MKGLSGRRVSNGGIHGSLLALARVTLWLCGALGVEEIKGGALASRAQPMEAGIEDVVDLPEFFSHRVVGRARMVSEIVSPPGKPLQTLHRRRNAESLIQVIPVIQQRPRVFTPAIFLPIVSRSSQQSSNSPLRLRIIGSSRSADPSSTDKDHRISPRPCSVQTH